MKIAPVKRTLLDTLTEYRDQPWQPRGTKVHNGYRQRISGGIRYANHD